MSEHSTIDAGLDRPRSRFAFLLRPWFLVIVTSIVFLMAAALVYRSTRFSGILPIDEIVDLEAEETVRVSDDDNAFTFYQSAVSMLPPVPKEVDLNEAITRATQGDAGWAAVRQEERDYLNSCEAALIEWQRGTELREAVFVADANAEFAENPVLELQRLGILADLKAVRCLDEGKTEEAWHWLRAFLRSSRHVGQHGFTIDRAFGAALHELAAQTIATWAADERVSADDLQQALIEVREIYRLTPANSVTLKKDYIEIMRALSSSSLKDFYGEGFVRRQWRAGHMFLLGDPELCQVLTRHFYANHLSQCDLPRWERTLASTRHELFRPTGLETPPLMNVGTLDDALARSRLARMTCPRSQILFDLTDREQAVQTALELCQTAERFRRKYRAYPDSLDALVPEFLDEIPRDLFGTGPAERMLMIRRDVEIRDKDDQPLPPGLIIYSRGLDGKDSRGLKEDGDDVGLRIPLPPAGVKPE